MKLGGGCIFELRRVPDLAKGFNHENKSPTALANGQTGKFSGIEIAVPAYNLPAEPQKFHTKGRGNDYVLTLGGKRIYVSGDTEDVPKMLALKNIDVAFLYMSLPNTMTVEQAARAVRAFKATRGVFLPLRRLDLAKFKELVGADAGIEVRVRNWYPTGTTR